MQELLSASSYAPRLLSAPFLVAFVVLAIVSAYALLVRGVPLARWSILGFSAGLAVYVAAQAVAASLVSEPAAIAIYRVGVAFIPMTASCAMIFQLGLIERYHVNRRWAQLAIGSSLILAGITIFSDTIIVDVTMTGSGMYFFVPGWGFLLGFSTVLVWSFVGFFALARARRVEPSRARRVMMGRAMIAMVTAWCGTIDVPLAYLHAPFPVGWAFLTAAALLSLRSVVIDDLLRARALDDLVPNAVLYAVAAGTTTWAIVRWVIPSLPWWLWPIALVMGFAVARIALATGGAVLRREARGDTTLERLLGQFVTRLHRLRGEREIAELTSEVVELATGVRSTLLLASTEDWSWRKPDGEPLPEDATPDPLLLGWMLDYGRPILRDEIESLRLDDLRPPLERLLDAHGAAAMVPLANRDDVIGLLVLPARDGGKALRREELDFLTRLDDRLAAALVFVRMARQARDQVAIEREVELAAVVQAGFVPPQTLQKAGAISILGTWEPATQCGGDWWAMYPLADDRVLVAVGDVTGHGVAAAMVTAAAKGACDATVRLSDGQVDLTRLMERLDAAVRRAGAGKFHLTCFVTLIDPRAGSVSFANAGHTVPYLLRSTGGAELELHALVARGNPLGAGHTPTTRTVQRPLQGGDVLVWYTDGLVECLDAEGKQFGDRRMQRLLRKLDPARLDPGSVHAAVAAAAAAHRSGRPHDDDMTLLVANIQGASASGALP
jgi:serine phosphatase RsbU (regulator of sigma subunit)